MAPGMLTVHPQSPTSLRGLVTHLVIPALAMDAGSSMQPSMNHSYGRAEGQSTMASNLSTHQVMNCEEESAFVNHTSTTADIEVINEAIGRLKKIKRFKTSARLNAEGYLRLHSPAIAHAFGPDLANGVKFALRNDQLHMLYGRTHKLEITTKPQLEEALKSIRASWINRLAVKRRAEFICATKPSTTEPLRSAKRHVDDYLWSDPQARKLGANIDKVLSLVTNETWQTPGRWHDLQGELEKLWWRSYLKDKKSRIGDTTTLSFRFGGSTSPGDDCKWVPWREAQLHSNDIVNRICAKLRELPEISPFVRAPFTIEEFDPLSTPTRDGDVTRYSDTPIDLHDDWVRISGEGSPGGVWRALVCPSRTMIAALDVFLSTIDIRDFKKLKGYVPERDWHARLAHNNWIRNESQTILE